MLRLLSRDNRFQKDPSWPFRALINVPHWKDYEHILSRKIEKQDSSAVSDLQKKIPKDLLKKKPIRVLVKQNVGQKKLIKQHVPNSSKSN